MGSPYYMLHREVKVNQGLLVGETVWLCCVRHERKDKIFAAVPPLGTFRMS